jgi:hypothetical protein
LIFTAEQEKPNAAADPITGNPHSFEKRKSNTTGFALRDPKHP